MIKSTREQPPEGELDLVPASALVRTALARWLALLQVRRHDYGTATGNHPAAGPLGRVGPRIGGSEPGRSWTISMQRLGAIRSHTRCLAKDAAWSSEQSISRHTRIHVRHFGTL